MSMLTLQSEGLWNVASQAPGGCYIPTGPEGCNVGMDAYFPYLSGLDERI